MKDHRAEQSKRRRRSPRIVGPFNAHWLGALKVPLVVHDLSVGGCLILASNATLLAQRMTLEIHLPDGELITVEAEPLYRRSNLGFAMQFIDMPPMTKLRLQRTIDTLTGAGTLSSRAS